MRLQIMMTECEKQHQVPCYVLESSKPIWNGELKNYDMLLGTNVLSDLRFCIINNDGSKVIPERLAEPINNVNKVMEVTHHWHNQVNQVRHR